MSHSDPLHIRPAHPADRDAVVAMVATVWGGDDYVPYVWDEWLTDPAGPLLVGELAGRPVAIAKLTEIAPGEDWFGGLRVDPQMRGRGFARAMLRRCAEVSRQRGAHALRYLTDEDNPTMHRMGDELGFRLAYAPAWYRAPARAGVSGAIAVPPERLAQLRADLARSPLLARTARLYSYEWYVFELTEARLREHLARGEVLALPDEDAWAIAIPREAGVWLAHVEGSPAALERLCATICTNPEPFESTYARALLPPDAPCIPALLAAGFELTNHTMRVYELPLDEQKPPRRYPTVKRNA
jgi:GNAT superfamily N-acetyltransferase